MDRIANCLKRHRHRSFKSRPGHIKIGGHASNQQPKPQFDSYSREKVLEIAKDVDDFFSRAIAVTADRAPFPSLPDDLRKISVELYDLQLRDSVRPLNGVSSEQIRIVRENWDRMIELFREEKDPSQTYFEEKLKQERGFCRLILEFPENYNERPK
jgi:hypothetical protein